MTTTTNMENYDLLKTFQYGENVYIDTVESIDCDKLAFIVNNKEIFEPLLREDRRFKEGALHYYDPFLMAKNYLNKARGNLVRVKYLQKKAVGRAYAIKSLSLQNITRQIRQSICSSFYTDIDMVNAHPTILRFVCLSLGIACPILTKYVENRNQFFLDNNIEKSVGKIVFLSVMNGGKEDYKQVKNPSADFQQFYNSEIKNIHDLIVLKHITLFTAHKEKREKNDICSNHKASFMNHLLCDIENKILNVMWEYFGNPKDVVLCFDGMMLRKGVDYNIQGCEDEIFNKLKISIKLSIKPFEDAFDLSDFKIPKYIETRLDYYTDFKNLAGKEVSIEILEEWEANTIILIENGGKHFFLTKNESVDCLTKERIVYYKQLSEDDLFKNLRVRCDAINPTFNFSFWEEFHSKKVSERKDMLLTMSEDDKLSLKKFSYSMLGPDKRGIGEGYISSKMERRALTNTFNTIEFAPFLSRNGIPTLHDSFNTFSGFPLECFEIEKTINFENSRIYKHIKEEMMNNDTGEFNHFLDHVADIIQDPMHIKTNGHLFHSKQGMGKGMLAQFIGNLLGSNHCISFQNTEAYFGRFNSDQQNKLLKVFEEVSDKGSAFRNADRLKGDQSMKYERVEPKGLDAFTLRHCSRFWFFTNNESALYIEGSDRRYTCHRANNRYANNIPYFKPIWEEVEDTNFCKNAFEFFATRKYDIRNAYECYDTQYKKDQKQSNLSNGLKFLRDVVELGFNNLDVSDDKVKVSQLKTAYQVWCADNGVKFSNNALITQLKNVNIEAKSVRFKGSKAKCYLLNTDNLLKEYREFLKDPTFNFDTFDEE
jgi:hypothetical protein